MSYRVKVLLVAVLLCCLPVSTLAGQSAYTCEVLQAVELSNDGHFVKHNGTWKGAIGSSFTVNRATGEMTGLPFSTESWLGGVKVLYQGGEITGYTALVLSGQPNASNRSSKYIYIAEQMEGPAKPFWGNGDDRVIFSGTCF